MADREATSLSSSPGARLAVARKQAGMSLNEAAERLHLNLQTLEALEAGQLQRLGASVYVRGHLKRYAELVGVPEPEIVAAYDAWSGRLAAVPDLRDVITAPAVRSGTKRFAWKPAHALIGAIVLLVVMLVWWAMRKQARTTLAASPVPQTQVPSAPAALPATPPAAEPASPAPSLIAPKMSAAAAAVAGSAAAAPAPAPSASSAAPAGVALTAASAADNPKVRLTMSFSQDSWIEVNGADGAKLFHGMALAGSQHQVAGNAPLHLFLGNPPAVSLGMNGKPVVLSGTPRPRRFSLDDTGRIVPNAPEVSPSDKGPSAESHSD